MKPDRTQAGFSLVEVMVAMVISGIALVGAMGAVHLASRHAQQGGTADRALTMVQARLEAKRSVRWDSMLEDDLDHDGIPDVFMKDDGQGSDAAAGDGIYSAAADRDGIRLVWTVEPDRRGPLNAAGAVVIFATASYMGSGGWHDVPMGTVRANPTYVGAR
jgi:prepilin-type N-terminal cleavage/methylation domain-containing protein